MFLVYITVKRSIFDQEIFRKLSENSSMSPTLRTEESRHQSEDEKREMANEYSIITYKINRDCRTVAHKALTKRSFTI